MTSVPNSNFPGWKGNNGKTGGAEVQAGCESLGRLDVEEMGTGPSSANHVFSGIFPPYPLPALSSPRDCSEYEIPRAASLFCFTRHTSILFTPVHKVLSLEWGQKAKMRHRQSFPSRSLWPSRGISQWHNSHSTKCTEVRAWGNKNKQSTREA